MPDEVKSPLPDQQDLVNACSGSNDSNSAPARDDVQEVVPIIHPQQQQIQQPPIQGVHQPTNSQNTPSTTMQVHLCQMQQI